MNRRRGGPPAAAFAFASPVPAISVKSTFCHGHVAVVSEVISDREIRVNHANWGRQTIALGMKVVDISAKGD